MSYENREGYGVTRPKVIETPEGTWNFYPKKSAIRRQQVEEELPEEGYIDEQEYDPAYDGYGTGVDIAGFADAFDVFGSRRTRRR